MGFSPGKVGPGPWLPINYRLRPLPDPDWFFGPRSPWWSGWKLHLCELAPRFALRVVGWIGFHPAKTQSAHLLSPVALSPCRLSLQSQISPHARKLNCSQRVDSQESALSNQSAPKPQY